MHASGGAWTIESKIGSQPGIELRLVHFEFLRLALCHRSFEIMNLCLRTLTRVGTGQNHRGGRRSEYKQQNEKKNDQGRPPENPIASAQQSRGLPRRSFRLCTRGRNPRPTISRKDQAATDTLVSAVLFESALRALVHCRPLMLERPPLPIVRDRLGIYKNLIRDPRGTRFREKSLSGPARLVRPLKP